MSPDAELIHRFVADRSESAFTELVHRHLTLVHATALRRVGGDAHAADDVTQQVFVSLARKASSLRGHATLAGWLYVSTHHATAEWVRREQRRKQREATAHSMHLNDSSVESQDDATLRPLLDDALVTLKPDEREVLVLRFFSGRTFAEIGNAVQSSEEAARKRVDRALEKLHAVLVRRGVTSTVAALGTALTAASLDSPPAGLALKVAGVALTKAAAPSVMASLASALWPAATAAVVAVGTFVLVPQYRANTATESAIASREGVAQAAVKELEAENRRLGRDIAQAKRVAADRKERSHAVVARPAPPVLTQPVPTGKSVAVSPEGRLQWEGKPVTLDEFLVQLISYQRSNEKSRLVVKANGARFMQLNWVLEEARKVGITNLVIESDAQPVGWMNTWFL